MSGLYSGYAWHHCISRANQTCPDLWICEFSIWYSDTSTVNVYGRISSSRYGEGGSELSLEFEQLLAPLLELGERLMLDFGMFPPLNAFSEDIVFAWLLFTTFTELLFDLDLLFDLFLLFGTLSSSKLRLLSLWFVLLDVVFSFFASPSFMEALFDRLIEYMGINFMNPV